MSARARKARGRPSIPRSWGKRLGEFTVLDTDSLVIACADIGSARVAHKSRFGWWSSAGAQGNAPSMLADHVAAFLNAGRSVALGFECPLFVPLRVSEHDLTRARTGECLPGRGNYPWSGAGGAGALTIGLAQVPWVLDRIRHTLNRSVSAYLDWQDFQESGEGLFLWEGFVSGRGKAAPGDHIGDARRAVEAFQDACPDPTAANAIHVDGDVHSLIGAALLRTGWTTHVEALATPCLVIRAGPVHGSI